MSTLLESLLTEEQRAECERHDTEQRDLARVVRGEPYTWPMVPWRNQEAPHRRRGGAIPGLREMMAEQRQSRITPMPSA